MTMDPSPTNSTEPLFEDWVRLKERAIKTNDWEMYIWFLNLIKKEMTKLYLSLEKEGTKKLVQEILKTATCELKEITIKYKKNDMPF